MRSLGVSVGGLVVLLNILNYVGAYNELFYNKSDGNNHDIGYSLQERNFRKSKFFPLFTIIRFTNEVCRTTNEEFGVCFTRNQCVSQGGSAQGSCAQGLGVCCKFVANCGGIIRHNATNFQNPNYPSKYTPTGGSDVCQVRIRKLNNICQLRLQFIAFDIDAPQAPTAPPTGAPATTMNDAGTCKTDSLAITSSGGTVPPLCGNMGGQHLFIDFGSSDTLTLNLLLNSNAVKKDREWNIEVQMISCNAVYRAPVGCLQYFSGVSGQVQSFNFNGGIHLANQDYSICIRMEDGMRSIDWFACNPNDVKIMGGGNIATATTPPTCTAPLNDFLIIMGGINFPQPPPATTTTATLGSDRFCDISFAGASSFVRSTVKPFIVHFRSDAGEQPTTVTGGTPATPVETSIGFCLRWQQSP